MKSRSITAVGGCSVLQAGLLLQPVGARACPDRLRRAFPHTTRAGEPSQTCHQAANADVVVVGAGVVGLSVCATLLAKTGGRTTVTLVEKHRPCAGATGAGQGYIWLAHRDIGSPSWELARWSKRLWAESLLGSWPDDLQWQDAGSLLLARQSSEVRSLEARAAALAGAGLSAQLLGPAQLRDAEPALAVTEGMAGLLLPSDAQLVGPAAAVTCAPRPAPAHLGSASAIVENGRLAAAALLRRCGEFGSSFCFREGEGIAGVVTARSGQAVGVLTEGGHRIEARKAVVIAAGAWSGQLLASALADDAWRHAFEPRRGHLLEIERPKGMPAVASGLMEVGYAAHYAGVTEGSAREPLAITFTATTSRSGALLVGSSREFAGFESTRCTEVETAILARAAEFLPHLRSVRPEDSETRVGLRPFSPTGPMIGQLPGALGLFVAAGHEGSGLTLAPATAELITCGICGEAQPAVAAAFAPARSPAGA